MTTTLDLDVVTACPTDIPRLARVLSAAFADNPVSDWLFDGVQHEHHPAFFAAFLAWAARRGRIEQTAEGVAVAVWIDYTTPPDTDTLTLFDHDVHTAVGPYLPRWRVFDHATATAHPTEPHWWLAFLGVLPEHRGRGHGSTLLHHAARWRNGTPAYLEATSRRLVGFYRHHGFDLLDNIHVFEGPTLWAMRHPGNT